MYRARYILSSASQGVKPLFNDPIGWDEDTRSLVRDSNSFGILYDFATDLEFVKDGYDFIVNTERREGAFEAKVFVKRQIKVQDVWVNDYLGEIDLLTKTQTRLGYKVNLFNGGLTQQIKANLSDKFELETLESVDGETLEALELDKGIINGRDLEVNSLLEAGQVNIIGISRSPVFDTFYIPVINKTFSGDVSVQPTFSTPLKFNSRLNPNAFKPELNATHPFLFRTQQAGVRDINIKIQGDINFPAGGKNQLISVYRHRYVDGSNEFEYVDQFDLFRVDWNVGDPATANTVFDIDTTISVDLALEESLTLVFRFDAFFGGLVEWWYLDQTSIEITATQTSIFRSTTYEGLTIKKAGERLSKIITGGNVFKSDYFTNETFKDVLITSGKKIRGFPDSIELSLKELFNSAAAVFNSYYGVEIINDQERIVLEPLEYFFRSEQILDLGRVSDVKRSYNAKLIYNSIDFGYEKGGDYEENQGLDEYNTRSSATHGFKNTDAKKEFLSKTRADTIAIELTRRKQLGNFPTEDTQQDKDNFFIDCYKLSTSILGFEKFRYFNRRFGVDFSELPTGIFSPETAYNLRLTPVNNLFRNSSYLSYLSFFQNSTTRFVSALRNSSLVTKLLGEDSRAENGDFVNSRFKLPLFEPIEITFKYKLSYEELNLLTGVTDGVPNYYKLIRFQDDEQQINYGYLMSYEPKDEGIFTVLKANLSQSATQDVVFKRILASSSTIKASSSTIKASSSTVKASTTIETP